MKDFGETERQYDTSRIEYQLALDLMKKMKFGIKVLDVGAGRGEFADMLAKQGYEVSCVDGVRKFYLELARRGYEAANVDLEEEQLPFSDNSFDLVVSLEVIEHLWNTNYYLKELWRVLKPHGRVILTTPNYNYWTFRIRALMGQTERFLTQDYHKKFYTVRSFSQKLVPYFIVERIGGRGMLPVVYTHYPVPFWLNLWAMHIGIVARPKKS